MSEGAPGATDFVVTALGRLGEQEGDPDELRARERNRAALFRRAPPRVADKYDLGPSLGRGGLGSVYRAHDTTLQRDVAIKFVRARVGPGGGHEQLLREARTLARLSHPNVVHVHEFGTSGDDVFIVMELVDGAPLSRWVGEATRSWREVVDAFVQVGRGLEAAHAVGVLHGDIKPANLVVGRDGRVRVVDFGLARQVGAEGGADERIGGTPGYFAPEQLRRRLNAKSDQFSFCVSLFEALFGLRPFGCRDSVEFLGQVRERRLARPQRPIRVPGWLRRVIERGLSFDPADRYPSMSALIDDLRGPKHQRRLATGALAVVSLIAWGARPSSPCGAEDAMAMVWNDGTRARLRGALAGDSDVSGLADQLDHVASRWTAARQSLCQAQEEGLLASQEYQARVQCLRRGAHRVETWIALATDPRTPSDRFTTSLDAVAQSLSCDAELPAPPEVGPYDEELGQAIDRRIDGAHIALDLGRTDEFHRRLAEVERELGDLSGAPGHAAWWRLQLAQSLVHLGHMTEAEALLRQTILETERSAKEWTIVRGNAMAQLGWILAAELARPQEALHHAKSAVASLSSSARAEQHLRVAYLALAMALAQTGDLEAALEAVEQAKDTPSPPTAPGTRWNEELRAAELHAVEALVLERMGRFDDADQAYRRGLAMLGWHSHGDSIEPGTMQLPAAATLLHNWGVMSSRRDRADLARHALTLAAQVRADLELHTKAAESWMSLANALGGRDDAAAMDAFNRAEAGFTEAGDRAELHILRYNRAIVHQSASRQQQAHADYSAVIEAAAGVILPELVRYGARIGRGTAGLALGDLEAARRDFEIALDIEPDSAGTFDRAELRFGLARALRATDADARRVDVLLAEATEQAADHPSLRAQIEAWRSAQAG